MADTPRPLAEGNRFQRAYARWAEPYYRRMTADQQAEARRLDAWLYGRRSIGFWAGMASAIGGTAMGLSFAGLPTWLAVVLGLSIWIGLGIAALGAWMAPERFTTRRIVRVGVLMLAGMLTGLLAGFITGRVARHGGLALDTLGEALASLAWRTMPALLALSVAVVAMVWLVASSRRWQIQRELGGLRLVQERDAAAREAAEAQLKLLRAQIQPHFIFNTLSALQHWVDTGDARAAGLLRSLTGFLRGSTELLGRDEVTLEAEATMVAHYLAIQQARLGTRLASEIDIAPDAAATLMPPGVLLTLVENAVEHGVAPALQGGTVRVHAQREGGNVRLCVDDTGVGPAADWHEGVGLANCRQRLAHRFGTRAGLQLEPRAPGTRACITLPMRAP
jgi:signal transduction histidine kinase